MSGRWGLVLKAAVSCGLLVLLLARVPLGDLGAALAGSDLTLVALAFGVGVGGWFVNTFKWQRLLAALHAAGGYFDLLALNFIGMFYSLVLPGQVSGEIVKGMRMGGRGVPPSAVATSILMDRLSGLAALGLLGLVGLAFTPGSPLSGPAAVVAVAVLLAAALPLAVARPRLPFRPAAPQGLRARAWAAAAAVNDALLVYRGRPRLLAETALLAVVFQGTVYAMNACIAAALGIGVPLPVLVWVVTVVSLVNLLPVSLGGFGVREGAYALLLEQQGVPFAQGLALSLIVSAMIVLLGAIGGVLEAGAYRPVAGPKQPRVS